MSLTENYFDKEKLLRLVKNIYNVTGISISVYDSDLKVICAVNDSFCAFCKNARKYPSLEKNCIMSDNTALAKCKEIKARYTYRCHMGLIEVATPIIYNGDILGIILFGQLSNSKNKDGIISSCKVAAETLGIPSDVILKDIDTVRTHSNEYITSVSEIVKMAAEHIVLNKILSFNGDIGKQIENYINENLSEKLSVKDICRKFNICTTTLYNISVKNFGCSIMEHINKRRIERAKILLNEGKTLSDTAEMLGFSDINYFIRFFKSRAGVTPKQYQLNYRYKNDALS